MNTNLAGSAGMYRDSGFFVIRTPLLPLDEFLRWSDQPSCDNHRQRPENRWAHLRDRLFECFERPALREALFVASPSLCDAIATCRESPLSRRGRRIEAALVRYFCRLTGRATPFGLFSGCSIGRVGGASTLTLGSASQYRRHTRLDMAVLASLAADMESDDVARRAFTYHPNASLYKCGQQWRYVRRVTSPSGRSFVLTAVATTDVFERVVSMASGGTTIDECAAQLVAMDSDVSHDEALAFVEQLIQAQILVADCQPPVTGAEPIHGVIDRARRHTSTEKIAECLVSVREDMRELDRAGLGNPVECYVRIRDRLREVSADVPIAKLFQVDLVKPADHATLSRALIDMLRDGAQILHSIGGYQPDPIERFRAAFVERYERREVPLCEVIDEEYGIGFERSTAPEADGSPLLEGLALSSEAPAQLNWTSRHTHLLQRLQEVVTTGSRELVLDDSDIRVMNDSSLPPLPDAFHAMIRLEAADESALLADDVTVYLVGLSGPSGARTFGRFCHHDEALRQHVEAHLRAEEALDPDAVFAEVVHVRHDRLGNIVCRPHLRYFEIPILGESGAPNERQIPLTDLTVSVVGNQVVLKSQRLRRRVIPRLTNSDNFMRQSLGVYRFLGALQAAGTTAGVAFSWGPLDAAGFLPRVRYQRLVLARARWRLTRGDVKSLAARDGADRFDALQQLRRQRRIPRYVTLADGDNELLLDLENALIVETFINLIKNRSEVRLAEPFPAVDSSCVRSPEGAFAHEIIVPFVRSRRESARFPTDVPVEKPSFARTFAPSSEWLYYKIYGGAALIDRMLLEALRDSIQSIIEANAASQWFFLRYGDPDWHLRLRFRGLPERLRTEVMPVVQAAIEPFLTHREAWRVQIDTYQREVERYGGPEGVEMAEQLFHVDSEAVLEILAALDGENTDERWRAAFLGIDGLLTDFDLTLDEKRCVLAPLKESLTRAFNGESALRNQLAKKFRHWHSGLDQLISDSGEPQSESRPLRVAIDRRSQRLRTLVCELRELMAAGRLAVPRDEYIRSIVHMHVNRMMRSAPRAHEVVLYDLLMRTYDSKLARQRLRSEGGAARRQVANC